MVHELAFRQWPRGHGPSRRRPGMILLEGELIRFPNGEHAVAAPGRTLYRKVGTVVAPPTLLAGQRRHREQMTQQDHVCLLEIRSRELRMIASQPAASHRAKLGQAITRP